MVGNDGARNFVAASKYPVVQIKRLGGHASIIIRHRILSSTIAKAFIMLFKLSAKKYFRNRQKSEYLLKLYIYRPFLAFLKIM